MWNHVLDALSDCIGQLEVFANNGLLRGQPSSLPLRIAASEANVRFGS